MLKKRPKTVMVSRMDTRSAFVLIILISPLSACLGDDETEDKSGLAQVNFYTDDQLVLSIDCEIADTREEREKGLMDRKELPRDRGMLFYYEVPRVVDIWMKNTSIPLDIVFVDIDFNVIKVEQADPGDGVPEDQLEIYSSEEECRYVIEMNKGLSFSNNIDHGSTVSIWEY
ncbi:MAG: DUF192 domain-containing protein [Thermoplasmatota archaeon]